MSDRVWLDLSHEEAVALARALRDHARPALDNEVGKSEKALQSGIADADEQGGSQRDTVALWAVANVLAQLP